MESYPSLEALEQRLATSTDPVLFKVPRPLRSILSHLFWLFVTTAIVIGIDLLFPNFQPPDLPIIRHFSLRWLALIPIVVLAETIRQQQNALYVLERHRIIQYAGRLGFNYKVPIARYVDIRCINVRQDIFSRILNYGDVLIGTASEGGNELKLEGVIAPRELAALIDGLRSKSSEKMAGAFEAPVSQPSQVNGA